MVGPGGGRFQWHEGKAGFNEKCRDSLRTVAWEQSRRILVEAGMGTLLEDGDPTATREKPTDTAAGAHRLQD